MLFPIIKTQLIHILGPKSAARRPISDSQPTNQKRQICQHLPHIPTHLPPPPPPHQNPPPIPRPMKRIPHPPHPLIQTPHHPAPPNLPILLPARLRQHPRLPPHLLHLHIPHANRLGPPVDVVRADDRVRVRAGGYVHFDGWEGAREGWEEVR